MRDLITDTMVLEWLLPIYEKINNSFLSQSALSSSGDGKYWEGRLSPFLRRWWKSDGQMSKSTVEVTDHTEPGFPAHSSRNLLPKQNWIHWDRLASAYGRRGLFPFLSCSASDWVGKFLVSGEKRRKPLYAQVKAMLTSLSSPLIYVSCVYFWNI